jgi:predicted nucleic acid-binding protein
VSSHWAVLDTNIYVGHWERSLYDDELALVRQKFIVRFSSVVLSELRRGARTKAALQQVHGLHRVAASVQWAPSAFDWWEAGRLVSEIGDARGWEASKRREFQNDALIALTARSHGATVVTANRTDFELLAREVGVALLVV